MARFAQIDMKAIHRMLSRHQTKVGMIMVAHTRVATRWNQTQNLALIHVAATGVAPELHHIGDRSRDG